ncbi:DUF4253 domain-containing protein [Streptomyces sp. NPDC050400]|uniref:DUF4253 domain-containing protein n=1 Tax=Streptomyces sp. NPDC050400 TaxID=3365610 RepID=UPI0037886138
MPFALPDGLPPGQFLSSGPVPLWSSDDFPDDVEVLWPRLLQDLRGRGLVPLLCGPGSPGKPLGLDHVDAVRLEEVLAADFAEYRRRRLPVWTDPAPDPMPDPASDLAPDGTEPWPHDPGPPFDRWPGQAPRMPATAADPTPGEAASSLLAGLVDDAPFGLEDCRLVLVPARRGSDAVALLGWTAEAPLPLLCALLRSWEDRFGAQAVALFGGELHVSVTRPPVEAGHVNLLALEHVLSTADNIVDDPPTPFPEYATRLAGRTSWSFWWD